MPDPATASSSAMHVLALNSGSSSLKFGLYRVDSNSAVPLLSGAAEDLGTAAAAWHATDAQGRSVLQQACPMADAGQALARMAGLLRDQRQPSPQAIGHRIVHGGPHLRQHCRIDSAVLKALQAAEAFAPLHTQAAMALIQGAGHCFPGLLQVACLDTSFHAGMPAVASTLPLPLTLRNAGIQRYGFHGLSCESVVHQLAPVLPPRLLVAHLGNGASITAVQDGLSIDTSMGLTPTGGLIMGTRSGDLDPGVLVHLMRTLHLDAAAVEDLVDHRSGLLGLSGSSGDMRALHAAAPSDAQAALAIDMFCQAVAKQLGAMCIVLGGVDQIVFTGGIGEHDALVRAEVCNRLRCLGVVLDPTRNSRGHGRISADGSACMVQVLPSLEDAQIACHTWALCQGAAGQGGAAAGS